MPKNAPAHLRKAFSTIDDAFDPWDLKQWKVSILGDAKIYFDNPRIRESALTRLGMFARDHATVREYLREYIRLLWLDRRDPVAFRRYASMLIGERRLARELSTLPTFLRAAE